MIVLQRRSEVVLELAIKKSILTRILRENHVLITRVDRRAREKAERAKQLKRVGMRKSRDEEK